LDAPDLSFEDLPEDVAFCRHSSPHFEVEGEALRPKDIRQFLWDNRNLRALKRDRAFIWSEYDSESDISKVGLGTITVNRALERLNNGNYRPRRDG
jgi:hypothetical protein